MSQRITTAVTTMTIGLYQYMATGTSNNHSSTLAILSKCWLMTPFTQHASWRSVKSATFSTVRKSL